MRDHRGPVGRSLQYAVALLALVLAGAAPPAGAVSQAQLTDGGPMRRLVVAPQGIQATAYAGETRLYVSGGTLWRLAPNGRPLRVARLPGSVNQIEASPDLVALVVQRGSVLRLLAGPPAGPLRMLAKCRGPVPELPYSPMAVAGDIVAEALSCPRGLPQGAPATRIHAGDAVRLEPAPLGRLVVALAGAPGVLATATMRATDEIGDPAATVRFEVRSTADGALLYAVDAGEGFGLEPVLAVQDDGTAVFCGSRDRLAWASPSAPSAHVLAGIGCPYAYDLAISHGVIAYLAARWEDLRTTALTSGRTRTLVPRAGMGLPFAWNGHTALVRGVGCADDFLGAIGADATPYRGPTCDVRVLGVRREDGRRTAAITLACPTGCRGELWLYLGPVEHYQTFHQGRGGRTIVRVHLRRQARRMLHRYRSLPLVVTGFYVNPRTPQGGPSIEHHGRLAGDGGRTYTPAPPQTGD